MEYWKLTIQHHSTMKHYTIRLILILFATSPLTGQIQLSTEFPVKGEAVDILLEEPAEKIYFTYRPRSAVARMDSLVAESAVSQFTWIPRDAGVVAIKTHAISRNVSVRFKGISTSGLIVMLLAGSILFGGVTFAFRILFQEGKEHLELEHLGDT
jgi:hypothetical protein